MKIECTVKEFADLVSLLQNRQEMKKHNPAIRIRFEDETSLTNSQGESLKNESDKDILTRKMLKAMRNKTLKSSTTHHDKSHAGSVLSLQNRQEKAHAKVDTHDLALEAYELWQLLLADDIYHKYNKTHSSASSDESHS